jgi:hypothetical protein
MTVISVPQCEYFTAMPGDPGIVTADPDHQAEPGLRFFVPLPNGDSVRVPVCKEHCEALTNLAGQMMGDEG